MFGQQYAWIINTPDKHGWWNRTYRSLKCTKEDINEAAQHAIMVSDMTIGQQNSTGISRLVSNVNLFFNGDKMFDFFSLTTSRKAVTYI